MPQLNQIIAVVKGRKAKAHNTLTTAHKGWNKERMSGIVRVYTPLDEEGEKLQPERKMVQLTYSDALKQVEREIVQFLDAVATQEYGNCLAKADIILDDQDKVFMRDVPVTVLLFMEKQLIDLSTFVKNIPLNPSDREWSWDDNKGCYVAPPEESIKTQKVPTTHVKFEPTPHHPGQAEIITIDKMIGHWTTTHLSGAMPKQERDQIIARIDQLQEAVKIAREKANSLEVEQQNNFGKQILGFVFGTE